MAADPNKEIFIVDPKTRPDSYWGEHANEIRRLLNSTTFDDDHAWGSNTGSQNKFWAYSIAQADVNSGLWLEFGVMNGRSINFISNRINTTIYGFDSFEGLPDDWYDDIEYGKKGSFSTNGVLPNVNKNVTLIKGWYDDTLPEFVKTLKDTDHVSFIHIDCDLYSSTKTVFNNLAPYIKKGTVIMFDEYWYAYRCEEHEFKAFQEFVKENNISYEYIANTHRGLATVKIL
jgi:hypothetical protein